MGKGGSSSSSSSTETNTQNLNIQGVEGGSLSLAGNEGTFNVDLTTTDLDAVKGAADITLRALQSVEALALGSIAAVVENAKQQSTENRDLAGQAIESSLPGGGQADDLIMWGIIGAVGIAAVATLGKR